MSDGKLYGLAAMLTAAALLIFGGTAGYVAYKGAQRKVAEVQQRLGVKTGDLQQTMANLTNFESVLHDIRGDAEGKFGQQAAALRQRYPFAPPADGKISESQLQRFLGVKRRFAEVDREMQADFDRDGGKPTAGDLLKWNLVNRLQRLRQVQAAALGEQQMSLEEYRYVQGEVWKAALAAGIRPTAGADWAGAVDHAFAAGKELEQALASSGVAPEQVKQFDAARAAIEQRRQLMTGLAHGAQEALASVPAENVALLEGHRDELGGTMMAAVDLDTIDFFVAAEEAGVPLGN